MARTVTDAKLETRTARSKLLVRKKPFYRSLEPGRHIGYYKGAQGGAWLARLSDSGKYRERRLGNADDVRDANGSDVLSFAQAQESARAWFCAYEIAKAQRDVAPTPTVRAVVESYIEARNKRERARRQDDRVNSSAAYKLTVHVLEKTGLASRRTSCATALPVSPTISGSRSRWSRRCSALRKARSAAAISAPLIRL